MVEQQALDAHSRFPDDSQSMSGARANDQLTSVDIAAELDRSAVVPEGRHRGGELRAVPNLNRRDVGMRTEWENECHRNESSEQPPCGNPQPPLRGADHRSSTPRSSPDHPPGDAVERFMRREDTERFIEEVRGDDPELASYLRIEER
jgi:hypothetical protein